MKQKFINYYLLMSRMTLKQLYYRLIKIIKYKLVYPKLGTLLYPLNEGRVPEDKIDKVTRFFLWSDFSKANNDSQNYDSNIIKAANELCNNEFTFLNITHKFKGNTVNWTSNGLDKLWLYYLNYFEYLLILIESYYITQDEKYILKAQELINDWIDSTSPGQTNSWEAYPISLRLVNWSYLWEVVVAEDIEIYNGFKEKLVGSIEQQVKFLKNNLEKDLANNHYTANGKALFWIGVTFPNINYADSYLETGINILYTQLLKEVRNDGSQYENSTSYQLMTAKDYIEVLIYSKKNNINLPKEFYSITKKMFAYIVNLQKPDKSLPLLNDSAKDYPINVSEILAIGSVFYKNEEFKFGSGNIQPQYLLKIFGIEGYKKYLMMASSPPKHKSLLLKDSKYIIFRDGWNADSKYLLFDAGEIGPKHNAGHAHADNLSIILHVFGEDILIDPGTYEYEAGFKRNYYRSTKAHNTIEIEDENQSTFWGPFRVGYIANSRLVKFDTNSTTVKAIASHDGYERLKQKVIHTREIEWNKTDTWLVKDKIQGIRSSKGKLYYQIGNKCKSIEAYANRCILKFEHSIIHLEFHSDIELDITVEDSFMSDEWKKEIKNKKIVVSFIGDLPIEITTQIEIFGRK